MEKLPDQPTQLGEQYSNWLPLSSTNIEPSNQDPSSKIEINSESVVVHRPSDTTGNNIVFARASPTIRQYYFSRQPKCSKWKNLES